MSQEAPRAQKKRERRIPRALRIFYSAAPVCETAYVPAIAILKRSGVRE